MPISLLRYFSLIFLILLSLTMSLPVKASELVYPRLFSQLTSSTGQADQVITVSYKDFNGNIHTDGKLVVPQSIAKQTIALFDSLQKSDFRFSIIKPYTEYDDIFSALKANASFIFVSTDPIVKFWLVVNPVNNPFIVGQIDGSGTMHNSREDTSGNAVKSALFVYPAAGTVNVNRHLAPEVGKITKQIIPIFNTYGFNQEFQPTDENELYFGLMGLSSKSQPRDSRIKSNQQNTSSATVAFTKDVKHQFHIPSSGNKKSHAINNNFSYGPLPESVKKKLIDTGVWKNGCPVPLERLAYVQFLYYNYDGTVEQGSIVSADIVASNILNVFYNFYQNKYPIEKTGGGDPTGGGTGMFNCRQITAGTGFSLHSYGTAIDISYYRNPYIGNYKVLNQGIAASAVLVPNIAPLSHLNREVAQPGFNEVIAPLMRQHGFSEWGGDWLNRTDYMHFQTSPFISYLFPLIDYDSGVTLFGLEATHDEILHKFSIESTEVAKWALLSQLYPQSFAHSFVANINQFDALGEDGFYRFLVQLLQS